uniref:Uncharacterized protein n=1 Tax=Ditylenchus dipsaci TaxID=166011 RepID=A0A915CXC8_9BILA
MFTLKNFYPDLRHIIAVILFAGSCYSSSATQKDQLVNAACKRNPELIFCHEKRVFHEMVAFDPAYNTRRKDESTGRSMLNTPVNTGGEGTGPTAEKIRKLRQLCIKFYPLAAQHCGRQSLEKDRSYVPKCLNYFQACKQFIQKGDPLQAISDAYTSGVNLNLGSFDVKGIPFYSINEEGGIGAGNFASIPFGAWGGGFSNNIGVRDYYNQNLDVGANWIDGKYGYRTGWSVPLVQSLGRVQIGTVDVDNHYGVGGYYKHNQHTGVDWRNGDVTNQFGVGVPMAGVGINTGSAVSFPSLNTFLAAG